MICVADFRDLCPRHLPTLSPTFLVHCNGLNSIRATRTGLSRTCHGLCRKHLDMSRWFVSMTFVICVHDFPCGEVSVKVGVMEFGLISAAFHTVYAALFYYSFASSRFNNFSDQLCSVFRFRMANLNRLSLCVQSNVNLVLYMALAAGIVLNSGFICYAGWPQVPVSCLRSFFLFFHAPESC